MSEDNPEKPAEEEPKKKKGFFARLFPSTHAGCASCLTAVFLIILVTVVWIVFFTDPNNVPWWHSMSWPRMIGTIALVAIIPIVLYRGIKLWMEGEKSRYPDIDYAWQAGLASLEEHGVSIDSVPVFLIVGSRDEREEAFLMRATRLGLRVQSPDGPAALHWYANPDGIFLFCTDVGLLGALNSAAENRSHVAEAPLAGPSTSIPEPVATPRVAEPAEAERSSQSDTATAPSVGSRDERGTILVDQLMSTPPTAEQPPESADDSIPPSPLPSVATPGVVDSGSAAGENKNAGHASMPFSSAASAELSVTLDEDESLVSAKDAAEQSQRLQYVCRLLQRARSPLCPVNGILTLLPFELIQGGSRVADELQWAVKSDLMTLQLSLQLRSPVTAMIIGMEREKGFQELVRRVGRDRAAKQRFGRRFDVRCWASKRELIAFCAHVCGAFEDWVYTLFREEEALSRPGNTRLFGLLCKVRCNLKSSLNSILGGGFGFEPETQSQEESLPFSGCYFAATGESEDRQAFVRAVFDKMLDEQEDVEWSESAQNDDRRYRHMAIAGLVACGVLAALPVVSILVNYFSQ